MARPCECPPERNVTSHAPTSDFFGSKLARSVLVVAALLLVLMLIRWNTRAARMAEDVALDFVRMSGYTSEGYASSPWRGLLGPLSATTSLGTTPLRTAAFPANRMTDAMANHLVNIRDLDSIVLYPPDVDGRGVDFAATTFTPAQSLGDLDLPLSERGLVIIEERLPNLRIQVASRPREPQ